MENNRIINLTGEINESKSLEVIMQLLFLNSEDKSKPIELFINSNGGSIIFGLAILDTINYIEAPVYTTCIGQAASMGAFLLSIGKKGHRKAFKNSSILIHQPLIMSNNVQVLKESELVKLSNSLISNRKELEGIMAKACSKDIETLHKDCERDNYMSAKDALEYGLIDEII